MSNRRRKSIGSRKIKRNLLIRIARGSRKYGTEWPGDGRAYIPPDGWQLSTEREKRRYDLIDEMRELVVPYWRGAARD